MSTAPPDAHWYSVDMITVIIVGAGQYRRTATEARAGRGQRSIDTYQHADMRSAVAVFSSLRHLAAPSVDGCCPPSFPRISHRSCRGPRHAVCAGGLHAAVRDGRA